MQTKSSSRSSFNFLIVLFVALACLILIDPKRDRRRTRGGVQLVKPPVSLVMDPLVRYAPLQSGAFFLFNPPPRFSVRPEVGSAIIYSLVLHWKRG